MPSIRATTRSPSSSSGRFARVWIALHGPGGEDGTLQGALECLGMPYTGSGVHGLGDRHGQAAHQASGAERRRADRRLRRAAADEADFDLALERLGLPLIVKPATQGSSVGMTKVERAADLSAACRTAAQLDPLVFAEAWIAGEEYTVALLQGAALPSIRIETPRTFYDYEAKYFRDDTRYYCPSGLSQPAEAHLASLALAAFEAAAPSGWGRADFMMDAAGRPLLLEINTVPGMTDHSLVPMAARAAGIDFEELVWRVLETSFTRQVAPPGCAARGGAEAMLRRPRNRRKPRPKRSWLPAINWRALGTSLAAVAGVLAAVAIVLWALDQPIETVSVDRPLPARLAGGRRAAWCKHELHGAGLLSVNLEGVQRARFDTLPWVDAVQRAARAGRTACR